MDKEENKFQNIEELLPRFCEGMTSLEESLLVEEWIEQDEEHLKIVNQIHTLNLAADTLDIMNHADLDKVLNKVKRRADLNAVSWWGWIQRIAALLSIPLLFGCLWAYFDRHTVNPVSQTIEVRTNPGMTTTLTLPDSTIVYLNSESILRYPSIFTADTRSVELTGEAYFEVTSDKEKRFIVNMNSQSRIEVYGTCFNVEAYESDNKISTTLLEGSVGFVYKGKEGYAKKVNLKPNQKLVYMASEKEVEIHTTSGETETAWKNGKIIFNNTPMNEVLRMLGKRFNVEFVVKGKHLDDYSFTGTFTNQRLDRILEFFKISSRIKWRYIDSSDIEEKKQKIEIY